MRAVHSCVGGVGELWSVEPDNRAGGTALSCTDARLFIELVVNHCDSACNADEARSCIEHALSACCACHLAVIQCDVARNQALALNQQAMIERMDLEKILGTCAHAVTARSALVDVHNGNPVVPHLHRVERA